MVKSKHGNEEINSIMDYERIYLPTTFVEKKNKLVKKEESLGTKMATESLSIIRECLKS